MPKFEQRLTQPQYPPDLAFMDDMGDRIGYLGQPDDTQFDQDVAETGFSSGDHIHLRRDAPHFGERSEPSQG